jgi:hypothetical protein
MKANRMSPTATHAAWHGSLSTHLAGKSTENPILVQWINQQTAEPIAGPYFPTVKVV